MKTIEKRHYAVIDKLERNLKVLYKGELIAESQNAWILKEVGKSVYNPVYYFPKEDIQMDKLAAFDGYRSHCPIKGDATYWSFPNHDIERFAWCYENPLPRSKKIAGHLAFYTNHVTFVSEPI